MHLEQLNPTESASHTYLVADRSAGEAIIIDPVASHVDRYLARLRDLGLHLVGVVDTHTHADHVSGAPALARHAEVPILMHHQAPRACVTRRVRDGDEIRLGSISARVMITPGHTYDSITLILPGAVLTGDLLALGPHGHAGEQCSDDEAFRDSLRRLERLDPTTFVHGTHGPPGGGEEVLMVALARMWQEPVVGRTSTSRLGSDFRQPKDDSAFDALRSNLACSPAPAERRQQSDGVLPDVIVPRVSADELAEALRSTRPPWVVDVRAPDEFFGDSLGRVPDSLLVPLEHLEAEAPSLASLGGPLVLSCRTTARAVIGAALLRRKGLHDVSVLDGGLLAWKARGHPVEDAER